METDSKHIAATKMLDNLIKHGHTPGIQYILIRNGQKEFKFNRGTSSFEKPREINTSTLFNACSFTKTFTALATIQCIEFGKLSLEDPASHFIESYPYNEEITIRQLLSHSSGVPNHIPLKWVHPQELDDQFDQGKFFNETIRSYPKLRTRPGTRFSYSNINYLILGHIIEKITALNFQDFVRKNIIEKLPDPGIYIDLIIKDYSNYARGYQKKFSWINLVLGFFLDRKLWIEPSADKNWLQFRNYYINGSAYGGLISNASSMTNYMKQLFSINSPLLSDKWKKIMLTKQKLSNGAEFDMCLGWFMGKCRNHDYYAHPGAGGGYYCEFRYYPGMNLISGIMLNRSGIRNEKLLDQVDPFFL